MTQRQATAVARTLGFQLENVCPSPTRSRCLWEGISPAPFCFLVRLSAPRTRAAFRLLSSFTAPASTGLLLSYRIFPRGTAGLVSRQHLVSSCALPVGNATCIHLCRAQPYSKWRLLNSLSLSPAKGQKKLVNNGFPDPSNEITSS